MSKRIAFRNFADTFTSYFRNSATATRQWLFQDRDGTIADDTDLALKANLASPTFTGAPTLPTGTIATTQSALDNSTKIATTAYTDASNRELINAQSDNYTLVATDVGKEIQISKATAITLTIPTNTSVPIAIGEIITVKRTGVGIMTIAGVDGTVTITGSAGTLTDAGLNVEMKLKKTGTNTWDLQNGAPGTYIDYTPTWTGLSPLPTGIVARYSLIGKTCHVKIFMSGAGTSTLTTKSVTMPFAGFTSTIGQSGLINIVQDAGTVQATPGIINLPSASNVASLFKTCNTATAWTGSGNWTAAINFVYEIA